jgi:replication factor C subunit 3/5
VRGGTDGVLFRSTILALARKMYGTTQLSSMVLEMNASDTRGIDDIRDQVVTFASTRKIFSSGMKLVILDEADNMTKDAQFALRRVIEKYTFNTRFCLICNYVSKIIPALQSRCTRFRFSPLAPEHVKTRVKGICAAEEIECPDDGMNALLKLAKGDMRKVLNLLESSSMQRNLLEEGKKPVVDARLVYQVAGKPTPDDVDFIVNALMNDSIQDSAKKIGEMQIEKGLALTDIVTELHDRVRDMQLPSAISKYLFNELAEAEFRLSTAVDDSIQLYGLISIFILARKMIRTGLPA